MNNKWVLVLLMGIMVINFGSAGRII